MTPKRPRKIAVSSPLSSSLREGRRHSLDSPRSKTSTSQELKESHHKQPLSPTDRFIPSRKTMDYSISHHCELSMCAPPACVVCRCVMAALFAGLLLDDLFFPQVRDE